MNKRFPKILSLAVTLAMLSSLIIAPMASALSAPAVVLDGTTISGPSTYAVTFNVGAEMDGDSTLGSRNDVGAYAAWATDPHATPGRGVGAHLVTGAAEGDGDEGRIVIEPSGMTLGDITSISWWVSTKLGYSPHLDITLDVDGDGVVDPEDMLTAELACNNASYVGASTAGVDEWRQTFEMTTGDGSDEIDDTTILWATTMGAGTSDAPWDTLANWKSGLMSNNPDSDSLTAGVITSSAPVVKLEIEIDNWIPAIGAAEAYVDDIIINSTTYDFDADNTITLTFPDDTAVPASVTGATIQASPGWINGVWEDSVTTNVTWTSNVTDRTVTANLNGGDQIGEGATVRIEVPGITNPSAIGDYNLTVSTSAEAAVTSAAYSVAAPTIAALPGLVQWFNAADVLMSQGTSLEDALTAAGEGFTVKIGPGTYTGTFATAADAVTIESTGTAAETIIAGSLTIGDADAVVDGLTLTGGVTVSAIDVTIENSVFSTAGTLLANSGAGLVVDACTFAVDGTDATTGISATAGTTVSGSTFTVGDGGTAIVGSAIDLTDSTITGSSGIGAATTGTITIGSTTFDGLDTALSIASGTVTVDDGSVITNCGVADADPAISVAGGAVVIKNSEISNSADYAVSVTGGTVSILFNTITGNTLNVSQSGGSVDASHNWWGDPAGPAALTVTGTVDVSGPLGADATGTFDAAANLITKTTVGVDVTTVGATLIGTANYAVNPQAATPEPALADGFYDVYVVGGTSVLIKFYNANITENTVVYVWSVLRGDWAACSTQGINSFGGYAFVEVGASSVPAVTDLSGTPFALVEPPTVADPPAAPVIGGPVFGTTEAPVKPTFTWLAVAGATSYEFVLAEEIGQDDKFAIIDYSATTTTHGHVAREELKFETVYNWRVRAISAVGAGAWTEGFFTTVSEPEVAPEQAPPIVIQENPPTPAPEIILQIPPTEAPVNVIPDFLLWTVVAVGALLIIAVIVLIVRTRRVV